MSGPDFIIIGAMKCATSSLQTQLALQPGFFMTTPKEPNFFSDDPIYALGYDWYQSLFSNAKSTDIKGEASTHYTKLPTYPKTIERLKKHCSPETRFIYVMRNPMDRLVSHYIHEWSQGVIREDINDAIQTNRELIEYSKYFTQLEPFLETFGPDQILPVFYERFVQSPQKELERVTDFLSYPGTPQWIEAESKQNVSSRRVRKFAGYNFLVDNPTMASIRRNFIPQGVRDAVKNKLSIKNRPELSAENYKKIASEINVDLEKLGKLLGLDLDCGQFSNQVLTSEI